MSIGIASGTADSGTSNANQLYLMMNDVFHYKAKLMGFDYFVNDAGSLTMAVSMRLLKTSKPFCFQRVTSFLCYYNNLPGISGILMKLVASAVPLQNVVHFHQLDVIFFKINNL